MHIILPNLILSSIFLNYPYNMFLNLFNEIDLIKIHQKFMIHLKTIQMILFFLLLMLLILY